MEEGYIKFRRTKVDDIPVPDEHLTEIIVYRDELYGLGMIGQYPNGVGFGNVSIRYEHNALFVITGSETGGLETLTNQHYSRVLEVDVDTNHVEWGGPIKASSESMTHAMVYEMDPTADAVIHIHNLEMWGKLFYKVPTTLIDVKYGTPEMAREVTRLFNETDVKDRKIFVMGGHSEGVITFGEDLSEAMQILLEYL